MKKVRYDIKYVIIAVMAAVFLAICFGAYSMEKMQYPKLDISYDELLKNSDIKDFSQSGGMLVSHSDDPWLDYHIKDNIRLKRISVDVYALSDNYNDSQIYIMHEDGSHNLYNAVLSVGNNDIDLYEKNIASVRLDLLTAPDQTIGIRSVSFNKGISGSFYVSKLVIWAVLMLVILLGVKLGGRKRSVAPASSFLHTELGRLAEAVMLALSLVLCFYAGALAVLPMGVTAYIISKRSEYRRLDGKRRFFAYALMLISAAAAFIFVPQLGMSSLFSAPDGKNTIGLFMSVVCGHVIIYSAVLLCDSEQSEAYTSDGFIKLIALSADMLIVFIMTSVLEVMPRIFLEDMPFFKAVKDYICSENLWLNVILLGIIYFMVKNLFGAFFGRAAAVMLYLFFFIGNLVKLKYHDTLFLPMDILQIGDFMGIVTRYVPLLLIVGIALMLAGICVFLIIKYRHKLKKYRPNIFMSAVMCMCIVMLTYMLGKNKFADIGADFTRLWVGVEECVQEQGAVVYSYAKFSEISDIIPRADKNYSEQYMLSLKNSFDGLEHTVVSDIKPDVIMIMEESMFDVGSVPNVNFNMPVDNNINKYKKAEVISPKYGGATASVEFEALTGMSNFFFLDNIVPYVTYWNSEDEYIPSLAREFKKNGYTAEAIHPNDGGFYNRDIIYEAMGFDKFIEKKDIDYSAEKTADDGWFKDVPLADVIEKELNSADEPQFIFTVTVENHMLYESKYDNTEVKLSSDKLDENELHQLEQYSEGVLHADRFVEKMINIVDNAKRPTLLYIWGDHLPALSAFNTLGFIDDKYNKYSTPLIAYSNYKDIEIGQDYITPNQLAPQILKDSQIDYSSYFDFVYSLRKDFPIVHKEFGIDPSSESIREYGEVQYDLLFGEQYLLENSP